MVTFIKFMERLARGELKNTSAVEETNLGEICPDYHGTILSLTNQGLVEISTRLPLIRKLVDLTFVDEQSTYGILASNLSSFLDDTDTDPFIDDAFVKILDIFDEDGVRYQTNTGGHIISPTFNTLRFTTSIMEDIGPKIRLQYQAKYVEIDEDGNIDLPPNLVTALQLFVASHYISDMGSKEHIERGDGYFALFLRHVSEDEIRNTSGTSEIEEDMRFWDNGFV